MIKIKILMLPITVIEEGVNCWENQVDGLDWPVLPDDFKTLTLTVEEISDFSK